ncbi:Monocarboxylate transporter 10 [Papilio xuthus]|uniref:Monocarboxylate transporter 10 n=1 Tax=Papilio xuthus TaxID=66420 RepID=A0A194PN36_PAPXU|nr:Monocarboxylate transporter 10 [Papilio xuthus]
MGLFDGAFIALIGPIAFELCGATHAAQAIGCMLGLAAPPLSVGPPIAGYIRSITKSYKIPFVLAGISPLVGATVMFSVHYQRRNSSRPESNANGHTYSPPIDTGVSVFDEFQNRLLLNYAVNNMYCTIETKQHIPFYCLSPNIKHLS